MNSTVEHLEDNRVKVNVSVPADEFERAIDASFKKIAKEVRIPGFRPGKAPRRLLEQRMGSAYAREQALRDSLPEYYAEAIISNDLDPIDVPEIEITSGQEDGDVEFVAVVPLRPKAHIAGYDSLRVTIDSPTLTDDEINQHIDSLRERHATLVDSELPLIDGNYAQIDVQGSVDGETVEALSVTDYLYEVGSGMVVPKLDEELRAKRPGDIVEFTDALPERFGERGGQDVAFRVLVKGAQSKVLPEADDAFAADASEFETLDELKADVRRRAEAVRKLQGSMQARDKAVDAVSELVDVELPDVLVQQEMRYRLDDFIRRLAQQGLNLDQYMAASGETAQDLEAQLQETAAKAVRADLALRAVVEGEQIEVADDEVDAEVVRLAERMGRKPNEVRKELVRNGRLEAIRSDIARAKAVSFLVDHAEVVDPEGRPVDLSFDTNAFATSPTPTDDDDSTSSDPTSAYEAGANPEDGEAGE